MRCRAERTADDDDDDDDDDDEGVRRGGTLIGLMEEREWR